jgi:hypothetical protein
MGGTGNIMLSKINHAQKAKYCIFSLFVEPRPKVLIMVMVMMGHECIWGTVWEGRVPGRRRGKGKDTEG